MEWEAEVLFMRWIQIQIQEAFVSRSECIVHQAVK